MQHKHGIRCRGLVLEPRRRPIVMGILNVTPDSFSDGGRYLRPERAVERAAAMVAEGAEVVDVGGESTRPGAEPVSPDQELARVRPVIEALSGAVSVPISIDTRRSSVAYAALSAGCHIVNDVSGCRDPEMPAVLREFDAPVVVMHMKGEPQTMQANPTYDDVAREVRDYLAERIAHLRSEGVGRDRIIVDPGIGFGKRFRDNLDLLREITTLYELECPVLVGASRKRFLGELAGGGAAGGSSGNVADRLGGNLAVAAHCYHRNVDMIRVHDVKETVELFRVLDAIDQPRAFSADW